MLGRGSSEARHERDARRHALRVDDVGDPAGTAVLYFHGGGDSRLSRHPDDSIAASLGVRLIAVERCGLLDRRRTLTLFADDVDALADELELERFSVLGWSAGGPHGLAVGAVLGDRVRRVSVVAGMPTPDGLHHMPPDVRSSIRLARISPRLAGPPLARWGRRPVPPTGDEECDRAYAAGRVESFRGGPRWLALELAMLGRPWGFELADVCVPVTLVYGEWDRVCPVAIGRDLERRLPDATLRIEDAGHQLLFGRWGELLAELAE